MNLLEPDFSGLPPEIARVLDHIATFARPMIAGGAVRDTLLGHLSKDLDVEVFGCSWEQLISSLDELGRVDQVGKSFGVAKFYAAGWEIDFSLPRSETKTAEGHRGFAVSPDPELDPVQAAGRRDFTINAIAFDWCERRIVDPLNGRKDLSDKILRHSSNAFSEDPLRVLRGFQFCARFNLQPASETIQLCRQIADSYRELPKERVWMEWEKWAIRSVRPSLGLHFLRASGWLKHFPEVAGLVDCPQDPEWHPEGDVFEHTCHCLDAVVQSEAFRKADRKERLLLLFSVLAHDFGKPETTVQAVKAGRLRWISPGHDQAGVPLAEAFLNRIGAPHYLIPKVQAMVGNHMVAIHIRQRPTLPQVRRLARKIHPVSLESLFTVIRSDQAGRPPLSAEPSQGLVWLEEVAQEEALHASAPKPLIQGRHLIDRGLQPGPHFRKILDALFELQLDGAFSNMDEAEPHISRLCDAELT